VVSSSLFSKRTNVTSVVIQGSVLVPLLFNLFMTDLPQCVSSNLVMYADNSTLYRHIKSFDELKLQEDLSNIEVWSRINGMSLNVSIFLFMDVTLSTCRRFGRYTINDAMITHTHTNNINLLSLNISHNLS
jgi:hypothetical protein